MNTQTYKVISESTHECGQVISTVVCLVTDASFAVKPDPPFDFEKPFHVVAGPYIPPPRYRPRLELSGYCESMTVTNIETQDNRRICPKCGMDVPLPDSIEPMPEHDGKLDEDGSFTVYYDNVWSNAHDDAIEGIHV